MLFRRIRFGSPTSRSTFEEMAVMEQAVEHSSDRGAIAEQFSPVFHGAVGSQQRAGPFISSHDDFQ